jgi:hypothetical protein
LLADLVTKGLKQAIQSSEKLRKKKKWKVKNEQEKYETRQIIKRLPEKGKENETRREKTANNE